ncbi:MAG: metallophosphoesterase [Turicibacter sp.]
MKKTIQIISILLFLIMTVFTFSYFSNQSIKLEETFIRDNKIPTSFDGVRLVQFSDVLIEDESDLDIFKKAVEKINRTKPDIVIFTGDLFGETIPNSLIINDTRTLLSEIEASIAKIAVLGDTDISLHEPIITDTLLQSQFQILRNEVLSLFNGSSETLTFIGLDSLTTTPPLLDLVQTLDNTSFNILLLHEPNLAPILTDESVDVQLSGSCLGTNTKRLSSSTTPNYCEQFYRGTYRFADKLLLHVNEGLQSVPLPTSFLKRPTIHSFLLIKP